MSNDPILKKAVESLMNEHRCHTVILYGSRSRGDFTEESDYDLVGFRDEGAKFRDARVVDGKYLDAFVYPLSDVHGHEENFLQFRNGTVLVERDGIAKNLLSRLDEIFLQGPKALPADELQAIRVWVGRMLGRIQKGDTEGNFRRAWLQHDLLENYFALRGLWYLGPKESLLWLGKNDSSALALFEAALAPNASFASIEALAAKVLNF